MRCLRNLCIISPGVAIRVWRSEEHTSELQSQSNLVCRLLLEKKTQNLRCYRRDGSAYRAGASDGQCLLLRSEPVSPRLPIAAPAHCVNTAHDQEGRAGQGVDA